MGAKKGTNICCVLFSADAVSLAFDPERRVSAVMQVNVEM